MSGVLAWVTWLVCYWWWLVYWSECCSKYQGGVLDSIVSGALFLKFFPKPRRKWIFFKARKRVLKFQVTSTMNMFHLISAMNMSHFIEFHLIIWIWSYFKVLSRADSKLWPESCQYTLWKSRILRFLKDSKSWYIEYLRHIQNTMNL